MASGKAGGVRLKSLALLGGRGGGGKASRRRVSEVGRSVGLGEGPEGEGAEAEHRASDPRDKGCGSLMIDSTQDQ